MAKALSDVWQKTHDRFTAPHFRDIWHKLENANSVNIYTHRGPDGDSIGACVAIKRMLLSVSSGTAARDGTRDASQVSFAVG